MSDQPVSALIKGSELSALLASSSTSRAVVIFDASWYLPGEQRDARRLYRETRLPGARFFDIDAVADTTSRLPHMVPGVASFERAMNDLGVRNDQRVIFYDQQGLFSAARAWWLMRLFGHADCAVLDGGLPSWRREGGAVVADEPPAPTSSEAPSEYRASFNARYLRGLGDMLENLVSQREQVLDARSAERFFARAPEPRSGMRGGHIPGSRSLPYNELLTADKTFRSPTELRALFGARGVDAQTAVVTSCGSGVNAAVLNLGLQVAGWPIGALYDGSWAEWGSRTDTPIER